MFHKFVVPPATLLPPYPPFNNISDKKPKSPIHLPNIKTKNSSKVGKISKTHKLQLTKQNSTTQTELIRNFVCRLCGLDCVRSELLYAHLLILVHQVHVDTPSNSIQFLCRRCGQTWNSNTTNMNVHICVQQKAAYMKLTNKPQKIVKYGLPFVCLYCCADREDYHHRWKSQQILKACHKVLRPHEVAHRFKSKLHLIVHILCKHSIGRAKGSCGECVYQDVKNLNYLRQTDVNERAFWINKTIKAHGDEESSSSSSEGVFSIQGSTDSLCKRKGLSSLEQHIDVKHLEQFELMYWLKNPFRESWIYACPLCELLNDNEDINYFKIIKSNALLQAHIVCYHANAKQYDLLFGRCQVCDDSNISNMKKIDLNKQLKQSTQHMIRAGHVKRLKDNFERAIEQGRMQLDTSVLECDFGTTCLLCWQKFGLPTDIGNEYKNLVAQCHLQAHLLIRHCAFLKPNDSSPTGGLPRCGWCGKTMIDYNSTGEQYLGQYIENNQNYWKAVYDWYTIHERQHALGLADWWWKIQAERDRNKDTSILY